MTLLTMVLGSSPSLAQQSREVVSDPPARIAAVPIGGTADHVHLINTARATPESDTLLITLRIDPGYHVNANPASSEYFIPTSVAFSDTTPTKIDYPPPVHFKPRFVNTPIDVYEATVVIAVTFAAGTLDRIHPLRFSVTAQACTDVICLPPDNLLGIAK